MTIFDQKLKSKLKQPIANLLVFLALLLCPVLSSAQDCICTNCPGTIPSGPTTLDFEFDIDGAVLNDLSSSFQGVCGVAIEFSHSFIWKVEMTLISPSGQSVNLIGPNIDPPLGSFTGFANWDILFSPCGDAVSPDAGFAPIWDNDQTWQTGGQYSGSYYPFAGCLEDFNTGAVNGTWTLQVTNSHGLYTGQIKDFTVLFCNETGLNCFTCEADAGDLSNINDMEFCEADSLLNLTIEPKYNPGPPDPMVYDYQFIISQADIILAIDSFPDLRQYPEGTYEICGLSFLAEDSLSLPTPNGFTTVSTLRDELTSLTPDFCGAVSIDCIEVVILPTRTLLRDTICEGETYLFGGIMVDTTGEYRDTLTSSFNCPDSIVTLDLLVLDTVLVNIVESFCEGEIYTYRGVDYTSTAVEVLRFPVPNGKCDTTVVLDLTFNPAINTTIRDTICEGETYTFVGTDYNMGGSYSIVLPAPGDCDTTINLELVMIDSIITNLTETICAGEQYTVGTENFTTTGAYEVLLPAALSNCDSIVRLNLTVSDSINTFLSDTICFGEVYNVGEETFDQSGMFMVPLDAFSMCDSLVFLNLTIRDEITTDLVETICDGENYSVGDSLFNSTGMFEVVLLTTENCDSTVNLNLKVLDPNETNLVETICSGDDFAVGDSLYSTTDLYITNLLSFNQCDSLVVLDLVVLNPTAQIVPPDTLDCLQTQLTLQGMAPTSVATVTYQWTHLDNGGTGIVNGANSATPLIDRGGTYELVITESRQNVFCTATTTVFVEENMVTPDLSMTGGTLTCMIDEIELMAMSVTSELIYQWSGPSGFSSTIANPLTNLPGDYQVTITAANGCTNSESVMVIDDTTAPDLMATGDEINCNNPIAQLNSNSLTTGVTYAWTGPNAFGSTIPNPTTTDSGTYTLVLTAPNSCTTATTVQVTENIDLPVFTIVNDTINCNQPNAQLQINSTDINLSYEWTGPAAFSSILPNPIVGTVGNYNVTVTATNGCQKDTTIEVLADIMAPQIDLMVDDTIDCTTPLVQIETISSNNNLTYEWSGPAGFVSNLPQPLVGTAGNYMVTVTAMNGCNNTNAIEIIADADLPMVQTFDDTLTCDQPIVVLSSVVVPAAMSASWSGPNGFTSNMLAPQVEQVGTYQLTVTADNGCSAISTTEIEIDTIQPTFMLANDTLNCNENSITLQVFPSSPIAQYFWTGPNGFQSTAQNPMVSSEGVYELLAEGDNGCENTQSTTITLDTISPTVNIQSDTLDCATTNFNLIANSSTAGVSYAWTGPVSFVSSLADPIITSAGLYSLTVTAPNFCTTIIDTTVVEDNSSPDLSLMGDTIDCTNPIVQIQTITTATDLTYSWTGPNGFISTAADVMVADAGDYNVTITANNSCTATATTTIIANAVQPDLAIIGGTLDCLMDTVVLQTQSSIADLTYSWEGPAGFTATLADPTIDQPGDYFVTVTSANGCQAVDQITIQQNIVVPDLQLLPDTLTCEEDTILLEALSTTVDLTYLWSDTNGLTSIDQQLLIDEAGTYQLTVTATNGCTNTTTTEIEIDADAPDLSLMSDTINCNTPTAQLQSTTSNPTVTYQWTGPNSFSSIEQDPQAPLPGIYALTITASNGCTTAEQIEIIENISTPDLQLTINDTLDCVTTQAQINSQSIIADLTYSWTGPSGFISTEANPLVAEAGMYVVTITAANACTNTSQIEVTQDGAVPTVSIIGGALTCLTDTLVLEGQSTATGLTYEWSGPNDFTSILSNPTIDQAGDYGLTITASNGCQAAAQTTVLENTTIPDLQLLPDTLTCESNEVALNLNSITPNLTYSWMGPNNFVSVDSMPLINESGDYQVTITADNGCTNTTSITIAEDQDLPDLTIVGDTINCTAITAQLQGITTAIDVQYSWTGPQSFNSTISNPQVNNPGEYFLTITTPNGCTTSSMVEVIEETELPTIQLTVNDSLDCSTIQVQINGESPTPDLTYSWSGPNGFVSATANPLVADAGTYMVTITASNACTNTAQIDVIQDGAVPTVSIIGGEFTCLTDTLILESQSMATGLTYQWSGPNGFTSILSNPTIDEPGDYGLTITASNGCQAAAQTIVLENTTPPALQLLPDTLTCESNELALNISSTTSNLTYSWTGPNSFVSMDSMPLINESGDYQVTITADNGCTNTASTTIAEDQDLPDLTLIGDTINCMTTTAQLQSITTAIDVQYSWTGPLSFSSTISNPQVSNPGEYFLTITTPNGCTTSSMVEIIEETELPAVQLTVNDSLDCVTIQVQINSQSTIPDLTYSWSGPNGFVSATANPLVADAGTYTVTITASNACTNTTQIDVVQDGAIPSVNIIGGTLTCIVDTLVLQSQSATTNLTYQWSGPNGFSTTQSNPTIDEAGEYSLTITAPNGCQAATQTIILENITTPDITLFTDTLTCEKDSISLAPFSTIPDLTYDWTGPFGFTSQAISPIIDEAGNYQLTVTATNGCTEVASTMIAENIAIPDLTLMGDTLSCDSTSIPLIATSSFDLVDYQWIGPNGFSSAQINPMVSEAGTYALTVTAINACTTNASIEIISDGAAPELTLLEPDTIDCNQTSIQLISVTQVNDLSYSWTGPSNFISNEPNPFVSDPGVYELTVVAANGCSNARAIVVEQNGSLPDLTILGDTLNCNDSSIQLIGQTTTPMANFSWSGPNNFTASIADPVVSISGDYQLTITADNGCSQTNTFTVLNDTIAPTIQAFGDTIDCTQNTAQLGAIVIPEADLYQWSGPNSFSSTVEAPIVAVAGTYSLTVTRSNGCTAFSSTVVEENSESPSLNLSADTLTCSIDSIPIVVQSNGVDLIYHWSGPNGFTSNEMMPLVGTDGTYSLTVTATNACTTTTSIDVIANTALPSIDIQVDEELTCTNNMVTIQTTSNATDLNYEWIGPAGFSSNEQNPEVSLAGIYELTATAPNGCATQDAVVVGQDNALPQIDLIGDTLDCALGTSQLQLLNTEIDWTYQWSGPAGFISTIANPTIDLLGTYALTITASNGCTASSMTTINANGGISDLTLSADTLDCNQTSIDLMAFSAVANLNYQWEGPNGLNSMDASPTVTEGGMYQLTITANSGCSATESILVIEDTAAPDLQISDGLLDCNFPTTMLVSSSNTAGVTFAWTGPNNFNATVANPQVSDGGNYDLVITAPNGCSSMGTATILMDTITPMFQVLSDSITCTDPEAMVSVLSMTADLMYEWSGPNGFIANDSTIAVTLAGLYSITVTAPNGCTNTENTLVEQDESVPIAEAGTATDLTCSQTTVQLNGVGSSVGIDFSYEWFDPQGNPIGNDLALSVTGSGTYQLVVTNIQGGCTQVDEVTVNENTTPPQALLNPINGSSINCNFSSLVLTANGSAPLGQLDFEWLQDNHTFSSAMEVEVDTVGWYTLIVANQINGCLDTAMIEVVEDTTLPTVTIDEPSLLTCFEPTLVLDAGSSSQGAIFQYQWMSDGGGLLNGDTILFPTIDAGGIYQLIITNNQNGCVDSATVTVAADQELPLANAGQQGVLDCINPSVQLDGTASSTGFIFSYEWSGPNILDDPTALNPTVDVAGIYTLLVTNQQNGCTASDDVAVLDESNEPTDALIDLTLPSCYGQNDGQIFIDSVIGGMGPFLYSFNDGSFRDHNGINRLLSGEYTLTIQDILGCEWDTTITLADPPELLLDLGDDLVMELGDSVQLEAIHNVNINEVDTLIWSPVNFLDCLDCFDPYTQPLQSLNYTATLINQNGCVATDQLHVEVEKKRYVYIPNAFSPDNDGRNDLFMIYGGKDVDLVLDFRIYDRWGDLVFAKDNFLPDDPAYGWDGTLGGRPLNPAVFVFYASVRFIDGRIEEYSGDVTLLK